MQKDINIAGQTTDGLKNLIRNHRNKGATGAPRYLEALREFEIRTGRGLDFDKSFRIIRRAAAEGRLITDKQVADASGVTWSKVHAHIGDHLGRLVEYGHLMGWPMLSAIVVHKPNPKAGKLEPDARAGVIAAAHALGLPDTDAPDFVEAQQKLVFAWGQENPVPTDEPVTDADVEAEAEGAPAG